MRNYLIFIFLSVATPRSDWAFSQEADSAATAAASSDDGTLIGLGAGAEDGIGAPITPTRLFGLLALIVAAMVLGAWSFSGNARRSRTRREGLFLPITVRPPGADPIEGYLCALSLTGASLILQRPLPRQSQLSLTIPALPAESPDRKIVEGVVSHAAPVKNDPGYFRVEVRFAHSSDSRPSVGPDTFRSAVQAFLTTSGTATAATSMRGTAHNP